MTKALEGKVAIVTGASRGIGKAISQNLASKGAKIVLTYVSSSSREQIERSATMLQQHHGTITAIVQADMGTEDGPAEVIRASVGAFGERIDIIVNNAGISRNLVLESCSCKEFDSHYYTNVRGPMLLLQAAQQHLPRNGTGRIINISSVASQIGYPQQTIYAGTKAALDSMTRTWARELAGRCTVNSLCVGSVDTDMASANPESFKNVVRPFMEQTPLANVQGDPQGPCRSGTADEVAGVVGMLTSEESGWCTGCVIGCSGGMVMPR